MVQFSLFIWSERVSGGGGLQMETQVPSLDLDVLSLESRLYIFLPVSLPAVLHFLQNRTQLSISFVCGF
jgi:hypothetical protein